MVKVALQISGRLRFTVNSVNSLIGSLIETLNPDVFLSVWEPSNILTIDYYKRLISPKLIEIENQTIISPYLDSLFQYNIHKNMPSMSYKFYKVSQLRKIWETYCNVQYDVVIQARSDNIFFEKLDINRCQLSITKNSILCSNQEYNSIIDDFIPQPRMVDNFYLGPTALIDKANETFWFLKNQAEDYTNQNKLHEVRIPEIIQTKIWQDNNISIDGLPGIGSSGNFWYDIDRSDTIWR